MRTAKSVANFFLRQKSKRLQENTLHPLPRLKKPSDKKWLKYWYRKNKSRGFLADGRRLYKDDFFVGECDTLLIKSGAVYKYRTPEILAAFCDDKRSDKKMYGKNLFFSSDERKNFPRVPRGVSKLSEYRCNFLYVQFVFRA